MSRCGLSTWIKVLIDWLIDWLIEIGCQITLITNRKSHTGFLLVPTSMTLNDNVALWMRSNRLRLNAFKRPRPRSSGLRRVVARTSFRVLRSELAATTSLQWTLSVTSESILTRAPQWGLRSLRPCPAASQCLGSCAAYVSQSHRKSCSRMSCRLCWRVWTSATQR